MSNTAVAEFLKQVARSEALQKELVDFALERGFTFTADELADTDLDAVVGGTLSLGKADDKHEREADAAADRVVGT